MMRQVYTAAVKRKYMFQLFAQSLVGAVYLEIFT